MKQLKIVAIRYSLETFGASFLKNYQLTNQTKLTYQISIFFEKKKKTE
jgi:hypothetical protein